MTCRIFKPMKKRISFVEPIALHLPKSKLIIGLLMVLGLSFSLYSFAYIVREAFRYVSLSCDYDLWLLSDEEVKFYNLVTAFIAVIISQSFCFAFWFNRPRRFRERRHFYFVSIVNDQMALNSCFLSWFSKLALVYAITLGVAPMFYVFSLYPDYKFVFVLLIVVLFLQSWTTIRRVFKRESLKWMLVSALLIGALEGPKTVNTSSSKAKAFANILEIEDEVFEDEEDYDEDEDDDEDDDEPTLEEIIAMTLSDLADAVQEMNVYLHTIAQHLKK